MRALIIGLLVTIFGPVAALYLDRYMSGAPEWVNRVLQLGCVVAGVAIVVLSEHVWPFVRGFRQHGIISTLIVGVSSGVIVGAAWWFLLAQVHPSAFAYLAPQPPDAEGKVRFAVVTSGSEHLQDVRVRVYDLHADIPPSTEPLATLNLGTLPSDQVIPVDGLTLLPRPGVDEGHVFRFEIITGSGIYDERIVFWYNPRCKSWDDQVLVEQRNGLSDIGRWHRPLLNQGRHSWC